MSAPPITRLGDRVSDDIVVYRAFAEKSFRDRPKNKARYFAYLLREEDVEDGLSVGLTPAAAVRYLSTNEGYCSISVRDIHALGGCIEVRMDKDDPEHAFICNLPFQKISDEERNKARMMAGKLAERSTVITCDPYQPESPAASTNEAKSLDE